MIKGSCFWVFPLEKRILMFIQEPIHKFYVFFFKPQLKNKYQYMNVYSSSSHNHQNLETTQMSFNGFMSKQTALCPHNGIGIPTQQQNEQTIDTRNNLDESQRHHAERKNPVSEGYTLYDYLYILKKTKKTIAMEKGR